MVDVEITVSDSGCGIPRDKLEAMFMTFEQADTETSQPTGLGLGLAVVARIVEQLGGQLRAESEIDVGTRFFFSLLMAKFDSSTSSVSMTTGSKSRKSPILAEETPSRSGSGSVASINSRESGNSEIETFVNAFAQSHMLRAPETSQDPRVKEAEARMNQPGTFPVTDSSWPVKPAKPDLDDVQIAHSGSPSDAGNNATERPPRSGLQDSVAPSDRTEALPAENRISRKQGVHAEDKAYEAQVDQDTASVSSNLSTARRKSSTSAKPATSEKAKSLHKLRILVVEVR